MATGTKTTSTTEGSGTGTVMLTTGTTAIGMTDTGTIGELRTELDTFLEGSVVFL